MFKMETNEDYENTVFIDWLKKEDIDIKKVNEIAQDPKKQILIELDNTKLINIDMLKSFPDNVYIRVSGSYDEDRIRQYNNVPLNDQIRNTQIRSHRYFLMSVIYERKELINILREIERIESGINKNWSDVQKLYYFYDVIKKSIMYDPEYDKVPMEEINSLRGLIRKRTVCAGYAVILQEFLDRQGINSYFISGINSEGIGHAWNIVEIEGELYPIDITGDGRLYRTGYPNHTEYFGRNIKRFNREHIPNKKNPCSGYQDKLSEFDEDFIKYLDLIMVKNDVINYNKTITVKEYKNMKEEIYRIPSFEQLKEYYTKYKMQDKDCDTLDRVKVLERGSNIEVTDPKIKATAYIALRWEDVIGRGLLSFSDDNKEIYLDIVNRLINQMKEKNMLDTLQLLRDVYDDDYKRNIVINLFNDQHRSRVLSEYFYKALYNEGTYFSEATALFNEDYARELLSFSKGK